MGGFVLSKDGTVIPLQPGAQRVIAYAALQNRPIARSVVAGTLWPDTTDGRAAARLRSALWRLGALDGSLIRVEQGTIALAPTVDVDVRDLTARARRLLSPPEPRSSAASSIATSPSLSIMGESDTAMFEVELLPGWWDEWVIAERERLRIMQLAALEQIGQTYLDGGQYARVLDVCQRLTIAEPLRESTHRLIMRAHLLQGNRAQAVRHYLAFRDLLAQELSIMPSSQMESLLSAARGTPLAGPAASAPPGSAAPAPR